MVLGVCINCKKEKKIAGSGKSKGLCNPCYRHLIWKRKLTRCPRCERMRPHHAQGLCNGCYNSVFNIQNVKMHNTLKYHKIPHELYKEITKKGCVVCGFNKIIDLHHLDMNHQNNAVENLTGLCSNHHKMAHHRDFQKEVFQALKEKGFIVPEGFKDDNLFKKVK